MKNKFNLLSVLALIIAVSLACTGGNQQGEANKLVDEANKKLETAKTLMNKTEERSEKLFGKEIQTVAQMNIYKEKMKGEAKEIADDYEKVSTMLKEISKKYDEASQLKVSDKYKEYTKIKSDEFAKRAEAISTHKRNAQAFVDISDSKQMTEKFAENNKTSAALYQEADELADKARKMETDNKDIFKEN